jgi:2-hydroxy-6-oxonona-2,4-dienedioate hydrolase
VVRGARDPVAPQRWVEEATRLLPRGELRVVPGAAHTMVAVAALELTRVVRPFLLRLEAQQRQLEAA